MKEHFLLNQKEYYPFNHVFGEISRWIDFYNSSHHAEMLPKTPEELEAIYRKGLSVIAMDSQGKEIIGHVALYPLLDTSIEGIYLRLLELGSWIVAPEYRHYRTNGLTIGEQIAQKLIQMHPSLPIIATVKRENSRRGLERIGFEMVEFNKFPFIAALTCVCRNSSEHFGHQCHYRKRENHDNSLYISHMLNSNSSSIPCTLLGYNLDALEKLNTDLKGLINQYIQTTPDDLKKIFEATRNFFNQHDINIV